MDYLESWSTGPLFKMVTVSEADLKTKFNPTAKYPVSVSKINQLLSFIIVMILIIIGYYELYKLNIHDKVEICFSTLFIISTICLISVHLLALYFCRSNEGKFEKKNEETIFINDIRN